MPLDRGVKCAEAGDTEKRLTDNRELTGILAGCLHQPKRDGKQNCGY